MSLLSKLFGKSAPPPGPEPQDYKGFSITPAPEKAADGYRIAALIEKQIEGETRRHTLIRADVIASQEDASAASLRKAQQLIDEQGERLF